MCRFRAARDADAAGACVCLCTRCGADCSFVSLGACCHGLCCGVAGIPRCSGGLCPAARDACVRTECPCDCCTGECRCTTSCCSVGVPDAGLNSCCCCSHCDATDPRAGCACCQHSAGYASCTSCCGVCNCCGDPLHGGACDQHLAAASFLFSTWRDTRTSSRYCSSLSACSCSCRRCFGACHTAACAPTPRGCAQGRGPESRESCANWGWYRLDSHSCGRAVWGWEELLRRIWSRDVTWCEVLSLAERLVTCFALRACVLCLASRTRPAFVVLTLLSGGVPVSCVLKTFS